MMRLRLPSREKDHTDKIPLTAREIHGNLVFSGQWVTAWFILAPVQWPFRPDEERRSWAVAAAAQYAQLAGHRIFERTTSRPYPVAQWAKALDGRTPNPLPLSGDESWPEFLRRRQVDMYGSHLSQKEVYIGVRFNPRTPMDQLVEMFGRGRNVERDRVAEKAQHFASILAGGALGARPTTGAETEWLMHRSVSLGLPVPYDIDSTGTWHWLDEDFGVFTDGVWYEDSRFGRAVKVTSRRADAELTRHVAVVSLGKMTGISLPETSRYEWLHLLDSLPFPVERISTLDVEKPEVTRKRVNRILLAIRDQQKHYREHDLDVPQDLAAKAEQALAIDSQLTDGLDAERVRLAGWHRVAVWGATEDECMARVRAVTDAYRNRISVHLPRIQLSLMREFIPGEPLATTAYARRYTALFHAAGAPTASAALGDQVGDRLGSTVGTIRRPVMFDPWLPIETLDSSGMYPVIGTLGAGKSVLMGRIIASAARRTIPAVILDPSVTLAGLGNLPWLKPHFRSLDLRQAPPGTLNPFAVIPNPTPDQYNDADNPEAAFRDATKRALAERFQLVLDICQTLIPPQYRRHEATDRVLRDAIRDATAEPNPSLWHVVKLLEQGEENARVIARVLRDVNDMTVEGALFFPEGDAAPPGGGSLITVITTAGITLPQPGSDEDKWSPAERVAVPLLALAAGYASKLVYQGNRRGRKLLVLDEMHVLSDWSSGRALFRRLARDSRKFNAAILAAGQNPDDALGLKVENLIGGAFVGRVADHNTAREALRLLRIPEGVGYEDTVRNLSPVEDRDRYRDFLMLDCYGRTDRLRVTFDDEPEILAALNTRPGENL